MKYEIDSIRSHFPALNREIVFLDNPAGTQINRLSLDRIQNYLIKTNANHEGAFPTSQASDKMVDDTRQAMADFINAARPEEIIFGANMTTLTFHISRSIARWLSAGDLIVVSRLDHDANISPWLKVAEDRGCKVAWIDFNPETGCLDLDQMEKALEKGPKLVAVGYASNALGTINPVKQIIAAAHQAGALVYIDAVQYAPHGPIDVQDLDCDFLVCSAYKFYGPHLGILFGKYDLLEKLEAYRVRPAPLTPPGKFETGTGCFENIAGLFGALDYFEWIGNTFSKESAELEQKFHGRALTYKKAMHTIEDYERGLSQSILDWLHEIPGLKIYGITATEALAFRVPTFGVTIKNKHPRDIAVDLAKENIYVWDGNFYALAVTEHLGLEESGGLVRIGATHYNTFEEISTMGNVLTGIAKK